ncbi:hypothetical protein V8G54_031261 [Vigna mungo]|uniref:Uncharacterized protein n=1 Tax=Vigna mungo TaxID=3915 RepID=A0AAQ3MXT4_VIGMU
MWVERCSDIVFDEEFSRDCCRRTWFSDSMSENFSSSLCIAVFNWIIFDSASKVCFNLSSLILFASSYLFSVSPIFSSNELTRVLSFSFSLVSFSNRAWSTTGTSCMTGALSASLFAASRSF